MTELQHALRSLGNLPSNCLHKNPAGTWSFVGSVDTRLSGINEDGSAPTAEQIYKAKQFGQRFGGFKVRTWATKEAAIASATALGLSVTLAGESQPVYYLGAVRA